MKYLVQRKVAGVGGIFRSVTFVEQDVLFGWQIYYVADAYRLHCAKYPLRLDVVGGYV